MAVRLLLEVCVNAAGTLRKWFALAVVHVASRRVYVSPATFRPTAAWVTEQAGPFVAQAYRPSLGGQLHILGNFFRRRC
jgi:hypothetical protein